MGLIAQRVAEFAGEVRNDTGWLNRDDDEDGYGGARTPSGVTVTQDAAFGLSVFWSCVGLLTDAAAVAPKDITIKVGGRSFPEFTTPPWMAMPAGDLDPTYTIDDYFAQVALSMLVEGNYFVSVFPDVFDPRVVTVLNPNRTTPRMSSQGKVLDLLNDRGQVERTLGKWEFLHGWWMPPFPGQLRGPSPLKKLSRMFGGAIAAEEFAHRFFGQGASLSFGVEVPYAMDEQRRKDLSASLKAKYIGLRNSHAIGVLSDGGKFVSGLSPTPEQAQMLETRKWAVEDIARIFRVPPGMVGSQEPGASSYASAETWKDTYKEMTLMPFVAKIEGQHSRLVQVPAGISDPSAKGQFRFNLDAYLRANPLQRFQTYEVGVRNGVITPDWARGKEDLPPIEGGDLIYMQSQMTPVKDLAAGQQPNPAGGPQ